MKFASFPYPYESVLMMLQSILRRKGFVISSASVIQGTIKARQKETLYNKLNIIDIKIFKVDQHETKIMLMINSNPGIFEKPLSYDDLDETMLLETIKDHF